MPREDYLGYYKELCWITKVATIAWIAFIHSEQIANSSQIKNVWKDRDSCHMIMPEEDKNILKCNQDKKCLKTPYVIYADTESLLEKVRACDNNPEKFSTTKISKHIACGYSLSIRCLFDCSWSKYDFYRGSDSMCY